MDKLQPRQPRVECARCGKCCTDLWLAIAPIELENMYMEWLAGKKDPDIHLLYPMLKFTGKIEICEQFDPPIKNYHYECTHLKKEKNNLYTCTIHKHRPRMCKGYPFYDNAVVIEFKEGCVYNNGTCDEVNKEKDSEA